MLNKKNINLIIFSLLAVISVLHGIAIYFFLYWRLGWIDMPMHFLGGLLLGVLTLWLFYFSDKVTMPENSRWLILFIILGGAALGGTLWEFSEYGIDYFWFKNNFYLRNQLGVQDTMGDLFFDLTGGLMAGVLFLWKRQIK